MRLHLFLLYLLTPWPLCHVFLFLLFPAVVLLRGLHGPYLLFLFALLRRLRPCPVCLSVPLQLFLLYPSFLLPRVPLMPTFPFQYGLFPLLPAGPFLHFPGGPFVRYLPLPGDPASAFLPMPGPLCGLFLLYPCACGAHFQCCPCVRVGPLLPVP